MSAARKTPEVEDALPAVVEEPRALLNPATGEVLPATPENAATVLAALRELRWRLASAIKECEAVLAEESARVGTKTLRAGGFIANVSGGSEIVWDVEGLRAGLAKAECPEERIDALIVATTEYKVNQSVARQLAGANQKYATAIDAAKSRVEKPVRVSVKEET